MSPPTTTTTLSPNYVPDKYPFLTRREFEISAKSFIEQSRKAGDIETWNWVEHEKVTNKNSVKTMDEDEDEDDEILECEDPNELTTLNNPYNPEDYLTVDYHIIYSTSYKVPVLYFNSYHNDGTSLLIDEIYSNLIQSSRINDIKTVGFNEENKSLPQFITLEGYIRSWLSIVGPVIGVKISIGYLL
ncbi:9513_t:CDS:2 [Diversispora eburnea]|uniref:Ubiquitin-like-conjugating enzyme ATG10 n=1 Tax=Diversispora eburnea TaxID=1213867 RepID=A0A9N8VRT8_9GLOM|nr:9513_t:CDS:2 [Diversispora eburnea]